MDIDSSNFDAKRYVLSMLKQNSIKQLMRQNNQIDEQIKIHDHQIQSLVFQNYSKFISSIDTVREMKDNICMVDDKLKILQKSMDKISQLALKIDSTFSVKRKQIQKLDTINKDLQKLKNLCQFPNILQQDIKYYKIMTQNNKITQDIQQCFHKSILFYQQCYKTLIQLKQQPLIAPIYKQSIDKVETIRSTLKAAQAQFNKNKCYSSILRSITKKLLIITDDQVSVLRIYFHSWKERFGQACFKSEKRSNLGLIVNENGKKILNEVINSQFPQINEQLWKQFESQFKFIYQEIYPKLTISTQEIQIYITNYAKDIFTWALNHYTQAVPLHCTSLKTFIHIHHILSKIISSSLNRMNSIKQQGKQQSKIYRDLKQKMQQKFQSLGNHMLNFIFGRIKLYFLLQISQSKINGKQIKISQQTLKQSYIKLLNPLKQNITINFKIFIDDMQYFKNNYSIIYKKQQKYQSVIHQQIQSFLKFLSYSVSRNSQDINQELSTLINPLFNTKQLHKNQKQLIQSTVKQLKAVQQSGCWFIVAYHFLSSLHNNLAKKIIQNTQKNVQIPKNHNYANVFTYIKNCISRSLLNFANHFAINLRTQYKFEEMVKIIQDFVEVLNIIFIQTKRNIMKKPSFLKDGGNIHQTQILAIKKMHLLDKKLPNDRSGILLYFIRKILKEFLYKIRHSYYTDENIGYTNFDIYSIAQICYEMINVEQESQIIAFYFLINQSYRGQRIPQQQVDEKYTQVRKLLRQNLTK